MSREKEPEFTPGQAYFQSKLANILFARELGNKLDKEDNINVYALHPGVIATELDRYKIIRLYMSSFVKFQLVLLETTGTYTYSIFNG